MINRVINREQRLEELTYCSNVLLREREKLEKKLLRYRERMETDYYLTEKQFGKLMKKSDAVTEEIENLTAGIRKLSADISALKYQLKWVINMKRN